MIRKPIQDGNKRALRRLGIIAINQGKLLVTVMKSSAYKQDYDTLEQALKRLDILEDFAKPKAIYWENGEDRCPHCEEPVDDNWDFCARCGQSLYRKEKGE